MCQNAWVTEKVPSTWREIYAFWIHLSGNKKGRPQMSLAFNCRDWEKSKPKEIGKKVVRVRADTYHVEQTLRDTDRELRQSKWPEMMEAGGRPRRSLVEGVGQGDLSFPSICQDRFPWAVLLYACRPLIIINDSSFHLRVSWFGR